MSSATTNDFPRPLTAEERRVVAFMLSIEGEGIDALRSQVEHVTVVSRCKCGCPSVDFEVDRDKAPQSIDFAWRPAVNAESRNREGSVGIFDLMLWADEGWLGGIELVTYGDEVPPVTFPSTDLFDPASLTAAPPARKG